MRFIRSDSMKVSVLKEQESQLSSKQRIREELGNPEVFAFDIYKKDILIGFAMLRKFEEGGFFLWNYAIDCKYQNQNYGTTALRELIGMMREKYNLRTMTTTYIYGNEQAKRVYEKSGFVETEIVDEPGCHEVNMIYECE